MTDHIKLTDLSTSQRAGLFLSPKGKGRQPRRTPGIPNKTEQNYIDTVLNPGKLAGEIIEWWFESVTLKLADDLRYTPDFMCLMKDFTVEFRETKGEFIREDSTIKLKVAAQLFPFLFKRCVKRSKKNGGQWEIKEM